MAGLATHNFFSAAAGIAIAIALVRGFARHSSEKIGNFWVDLTRATVYVLLPLSVVIAAAVRLAGRDPESEPVHESGHAGGWHADHCRRDRWLRRKPSRCWAPTAAASSTPTRRIRSRIRRRFRTSSNCCPSSSIPAGLTYTFGKMVKDTRQGWAIFARHEHPVPCGRVRRLLRRNRREIRLSRRWELRTRRQPRSPAETWKARKCASASRTRRCSRP